ncbi:EMC8 [Cordylochernes scorpioides]|uniref:EMC8 n=1 Tax=Cordylochernes scorpioides TaxID=51811 RepID=A0ABY6K0Y9_9ARAC|nr:EMC8 [Cordylochernes scorpioides]
MSEVTMSPQAYCKMVLHALKYPHKTVNGVFLAEQRANKDDPINLVDAIPLFHINLHLTPMLEVAFLQIDHYAQSRDLTIAGYYQANEFQKDSSPNLLASKIAEKIAEYYPDCCIVMVDGQKLHNMEEELPCHLYQLSGERWKERGGLQVDSEMALEVASNLHYARAYTGLVDFDNHLDNVALDWTNPSLSQKISDLI